MPPRVKAIIAKHASAHAVRPEIILGSSGKDGRRPQKKDGATAARWGVIADLYQPTDGARPYSMCRIAFILNLNGKSVQRAVKAMAIMAKTTDGDAA